MFIQLPLFFLYMAGQNEWNNVWLGSCVAMVLIYYQGTDWRLATWGVLTAVIIIGINYFIQYTTVLYSVALLVFGCVFVFAWVAALVIGASAANLQKQHLLNTAYNLGVMAHELRTPIASIGLLSSVLKNKRGLIQHDDLLKLATRLDVLVKTINSHIDNQISNSKLIDIKNTADSSSKCNVF
jgi:signal transduction histidine kinase